jgi:hypothetical protein
MSDTPEPTPATNNQAPEPKVGDRVKIRGHEEIYVIVEVDEQSGYVALKPENPRTRPSPEDHHPKA